MVFNTPPYDSIWKYFRDAALGFLIILGGFLAAGAIAAPFGNFNGLVYSIGLCVGMIPFWWFTRHCHIHDFDFFDYLAFSAFILFIEAFRSAFAGVVNDSLITSVIAVALGGGVVIWRRIRRSLAIDVEGDSVGP